jgi:hypothetical protein
MNNHSFFSSMSKAGNILGKGLIAGLFGTVAITISQLIEMKITKRDESTAPVKVGGEVMGVEPKGLADQEKQKSKSENGEASKFTKEVVETNEQRFGQLMHFGYGTSWGVARGLLNATGLHGWPATLIHFGAVWSTALIMLPKTGASEPITKWTPQQITIDVLHHAVYAITAGIVYDKMVAAVNSKK